MAIHLTTLGSIRVTLDGEEIDDLIRQKLRLALFVYLAVEGVTSREGIAGIFWRDREPDRARHSLSQTLYALRGTLGDGWLDIHGDRLTMTAAVRVDVSEFERLAATGETVQALGCYSGPFVNTFVSGIQEFDHWADRRRATLDRLHRRLRKEAVDDCVGSEDLSGAVSHARVWASMDVLDDEAQHRFIELLAASGERSNALKQYELYVNSLAADGLTPLEQTELLVEQIRSRGPIRLVPETAEPGLDASPPSADQRPGAEPSVHHTWMWGVTEPSGPRLVRIIEGGREGEAYPLNEEHVRIGRNQGDIQFLHDTLMSSLHASMRSERRLRTDGESDPVFVLKDEGSRNGVFVRIHGERPLKYGDVFAAGKQVFGFDRVDGPLETPEPESDGQGAATRLGLPEDVA